MPMISESDNDPSRVFTVAKTGAAPTTATLLDGRHRSQLGFRSGPLSKKELDAIKGLSLTSADTVSYIRTLEGSSDDDPVRTHRAHSDRAWPVNDRDYTETRYRPAGLTISYDLVSPSSGAVTHYSSQGCMGVSSLLSGFMPTLPTSSTLQAMAGKMLRNSRPPQLGFDLARFAGEQREAHLLLKASNYMPKSRKELAGAFLNYQFGLKPTGSDLGKLAELVLRSDGPIHRLLDGEKIREKKYGTRVLLKDSNSGENIMSTYVTTSVGTSIWTGLHQTRVVYPGYSGASGNYTNVLSPILRWSYTRKQILRTFSTWEYYVPQPEDIRGRLSSYRKKAELLLSSMSIKESTVWELTPWTWLSDWFVDIGGLLRYQREVVDNQMVATTCGYSVWEEYTGLSHFAGYKPHPLMGMYPYYGTENLSFNGVQVSVRWRRHTRRSGNPYSIGPTWSLTNQQWAILTALGLARGADLPIKR